MSERSVETVAVYKEDRVKVYGITEKTDLALLLLSFPVEQLGFWGQTMSSFQEIVPRFELVTYHASKGNRVELHLLCDRFQAEALKKSIEQQLQTEPNEPTAPPSDLTLHQPVDALYLFGPHFQDRFGIVDIGIHALQENNIDILASGCAGTSMYFVVPDGFGKNGVAILSETFLIPTTVARV